MLEVNITRSLPGFTLQVAFSSDEEILGIVGPSGSGKTMTLQCIAGLVRPDEGYISLNGRVLFDSTENVNLTTQMRRVGLVFQNYALFPHLTADENIAFGIRDRSPEEKRRVVAELAGMMELQGMTHRYPGQLSAGQQQRVALARALACEPDILLLDEPFSALDVPAKEHLEPYILAIKRFYKGSVLFVTHDISEAYRLSTRIAVYESGGIAQCDDKAKLISSPANLTVARLTGFRNFLAGNISEMSDSHLWVVVPGLGVLRALRHENSCLSPGMEVTIGIRSEHVKLAGQPGENTVYGIIDGLVDEMTTTRCSFKADDTQGHTYHLDAVLPKSGYGMSPKLAEKSYFHIPPEHIIIIYRNQ